MDSVFSLTKHCLVPDQIYVNIPKRTYEKTSRTAMRHLFVKAVAKSKRMALGVCGWGMLPMWHQVGVVPAYVPYFTRPNGRYVDVLQACCGNAYRRGFFTDVEALAVIPPVCVTVDDVWIAGYLRTVEQRRSALISKRLDPSDPPWKKEEAHSSERQMTLSSYNHEHQLHYKCVQALEAKFQRRWTRNFEENETELNKQVG
ncbi:unnamed protein product [Peronospora destructor]|uniref:Uncharacterized protein n=1 Tax=Peronospora destructor TaxID=86335 RepID=A0AAV0UXA4_9STRA|nr:unnamed protein product [Peronospora destructor]